MLTKYRYFGFGVFTFFVFIFALALGATMTDNHIKTIASEHCQKTGGSWNNNNYCEKIVSVCTPQQSL